MAKQIQTDHDLLITLNTKVDLLTTIVNEMKDGTTEKITKLETRVKILEDTHAGIDTRGEVEKIRMNKDKIKELEKRWRFVIWLLAPIYIATVGLLVTRFSDLL